MRVLCAEFPLDLMSAPSYYIRHRPKCFSQCFQKFSVAFRKISTGFPSVSTLVALRAETSRVAVVHRIAHRQMCRHRMTEHADVCKGYAQRLCGDFCTKLGLHRPYAPCAFCFDRFVVSR